MAFRNLSNEEMAAEVTRAWLMKANLRAALCACRQR